VAMNQAVRKMFHCNSFYVLFRQSSHNFCIGLKHRQHGRFRHRLHRFSVRSSGPSCLRWHEWHIVTPDNAGSFVLFCNASIRTRPTGTSKRLRLIAPAETGKDVKNLFGAEPAGAMWTNRIERFIACWLPRPSNGATMRVHGEPADLSG
jgi:hypothetical protein